MSQTRRRFLQTALSTALWTGARRRGSTAEEPHDRVSTRELERVAAAPVLQERVLSAPVVLTEMELLRNGHQFLVRSGVPPADCRGERGQGAQVPRRWKMSRNADSLPDRTERLIPLVRKTFGPGMTIYADSNSSYDVTEAIRVGRLMEKYDYGFFEEPCRFDHLEETKAVADALRIPVAGGEQEFSEYGFRWMIAHHAVDLVQPDLHYHVGFIRSLRVARMAHAAGLLCTPHMSGSGLGYLDAVHFVSCIENPVPFTEFKGNADVPVSSPTSSLKCEHGTVRVPSGPGFGISVDPGFVRASKQVTTF